MTRLNPDKLHVKLVDGVYPEGPLTPRCYTLTHSDTTGDLFLSIGRDYNRPQISGLYTRIMRDEVLAEWKEDTQPALHVHCHVSGGLVVGTARWRDSILRYHMPMVLEAFRYGDAALVDAFPYVSQAAVIVHFHARQKSLGVTENWGVWDDYRLLS